MRLAPLCLIALACAHGAAEPSDPGRRPVPASAGEGKGTDETTGCATDTDCALTRVPRGGCCPTLCTPRAVTRKRAEELEASLAVCGGRGCPQPLCRPPTGNTVPACVQDRCIARSGGPDA